MNFIEYFIVLLPISCFLWLCQAGAGKPDKRMFQLCEARAVRAVFGRRHSKIRSPRPNLATQQRSWPGTQAVSPKSTGTGK